METANISELLIDEAYLNGALHMASSCSGWIGVSEITAECFRKEDFHSEFAKEYGLSKENVSLYRDSITFRQALARWIGGQEAKITDGLYWLFCYKLGEPIQLYRLENEDNLISSFGWGEKGKGPYYFVEDLFFVEFENVFVCLFLGNNE